LRWLHVSGDCLAFVREVQDEAVLVVVARSQSETVRIPSADLGAASLRRLFGFDAEIVAGQVVINVPSAGAGVWRVEGM
jgi:hypothetical protein